MVKKKNKAAQELSAARWSKLQGEERTKATEAARKARAKLPKAKRVEIAKKAAASITPEAAKARARKAWETRRKKQEKE